MNTSLVLLLLSHHHVSAQLVGNRGVVQLPSGFEYRLEKVLSYLYTDSTFRDSETLAASARASRFAKYFQPLNDLFAEQNKLIELQRSSFQTDLLLLPVVRVPVNAGIHLGLHVADVGLHIRENNTREIRVKGGNII